LSGKDGMLLDHVTINDLWGMLKPHMKKPAWPGLDDPRLLARARRAAKASGVWDTLPSTHDPARPIEVIRYSQYRSLKHGGPHADARKSMLAEVQRAAFALWLDHPKASAHYLEDLLWAACESTTWVCSFHEYSGLLDLGSPTQAALYAEILYLLGERIEPEVVARVRKEIRTRVIDPGVDYRQTPWWATVPMNWNLVCNCNLITAGLYEIGDLFIAHYLHPLIQRLHYGLGGFAEDGGCYEGPGYWEYAFSHYLKAAIMLQHRTGGKLNILQDPKVEGICRFPLAGFIEGNQRFLFCDCGPGFLSPAIVHMINRFHAIPELYAYVPPPKAARRLVEASRAIPSWRDCTPVMSGRVPRVQADLRDHLFPKLAQVKLRPAQNPACAALGVFVSHNACPHNHNDVGSFVYYTHGRHMITDPGSPTYTPNVFGKERYEHPHTRTRGHSLPIVNGHEQAAGKRHRGTLAVAGLNGQGPKRVTANLAKAYPDKTLRRLTRELVLAPNGDLQLTDRFIFTRQPTSVEEGFATYEPARARKDGREVMIGKGRKSVLLRAAADTPGRFRVDTWGPEADTWTTRERLRRIVFLPGQLARQMILQFEVTR